MKHFYAFLAVVVLAISPAEAVPQTLNYQGRVAVSGSAFNGTGNFRFSLLDVVGVAVMWNQDGTTTGVPAGGVAIPVERGVFNVALGDTSTAGMSALPPGLFAGKNNVLLRVWFNDGTHGWQRLDPDVRLPAHPMAISAETAETVTDGAVTRQKLANNAITASKLAPGAVTSVKLAAGAVASADLAVDAVGANHMAAGAVTSAKLGANAAANAGAAEGLAFLPAGSGLLSVSDADPNLLAQGYVRVGDPLHGLGSWDLDSVPPRGATFSRTCWTGTEMLLWAGSPAMPQRGRRYDPATDKWTNLPTVGLDSSPPDNTTFTWTGTEAICWNGYQYSYTKDAIYNAVSKSWREMPLTGAPTRTILNCTVWTGQELLVWSGVSTTTGLIVSASGRFNPATNLWNSLSTTLAPSPRSSASAVWTGTEMIVWGGQLSTAAATDTGGRYNPTTNTWNSISSGGTARYQHSAVWTGSKMIIWGDRTTPDGAAFDPAAGAFGTWSAISATDQPSPRDHPAMVWTGTEMIVWGGSTFVPLIGADPVNGGGRYNPTTNTWTAIPTSLPNTPTARLFPNVVWTGTEMIVYGGYTTLGNAITPQNSGARYNPTTNTWTPIGVPHHPYATPFGSGGWNGTELIAFGEDDSVFAQTEKKGNRYNPTTRTWTPMSTVAGPPQDLTGYTAVLSPQALLLFGGVRSSAPTTPLNSGYRYDIASDSWFTIAGTGVGAGTLAITAAVGTWTGTEMLIYGGSRSSAGSLQVSAVGGRYNPNTGVWTPISTVNALSGRNNPIEVWTGTEWFIWGGNLFQYLANGKRYNPTTDIWTDIATAGAPSGEAHQAIWTGSEVIVLDARTTVFELYRWSPATNTWTHAAMAGAPPYLWYPQMVWTGTDVFLFGGLNTNLPNSEIRNTATFYRPSTDTWHSARSSPVEFSGRFGALTVWTGTEVLIFGGSDVGDPTRLGGYHNDLAHFNPSADSQYLYLRR